MPRQTIANQLDLAQRVLGEIGTNATLRAQLAQVGYDADALAAGQALYEAAVAARSTAHSAHGDQLGATKSETTLRKQVAAQVSALAQTARILFADDPDALETLGLRMDARIIPEARRPRRVGPNGAPLIQRQRRVSRSQAARLDHARTLYSGALDNPDLLAALADVGYTQARLEAEQALIRALEVADTIQQSRKADAKARTAAQTETLQALGRWLARLRGIARPALRDRPDLLDKLGM